MAYARLSYQDRDQGAARKRLGSLYRCGATGQRIILLPAFKTAQAREEENLGIERGASLPDAGRGSAWHPS